MGAATILIISRDKDFSQVLAEQVQAQLGLACKTAESAASAPPAALAVTTEEDIRGVACPVIAVRQRPLRLQPLLDDIAASLQKQASGGDTLALPGGYILQLRQKQLQYGDAAISLTDKEMQLLQCLAEAGKKGLSKDRLLKAVWDIDAALDTHTLETHIYRLRSKLRDLSGDDTMIAAVEGGYKWIDK